jgi:hypothetical protein
VAAAGLIVALSQLVGGWTNWGGPHVSRNQFLLGFLPALIAGGLDGDRRRTGATTGSGSHGDLVKV